MTTNNPYSIENVLANIKAEADAAAEKQAKRKADRAAYFAAAKIEMAAKIAAYVPPAADPRIALLPTQFANREEQAAWCAANGVEALDPNSYCVKNFSAQAGRASVAMEAAQPACALKFFTQ